jgi:hypothetical protein
MVWLRAPSDHAGVKATQRRFVVTDDRGRGRLSADTLLEEVGRFEAREHHGCIDSIRSVVADLRVLEGERAGELIRVVLSAAYSCESAPRDWRPGWLPEVAENPRT